MPLFENNLSPYLTIVEATEPSAPSAGQQRLYIDSTSHKLKATNSSGTERDIEGIAAGAITSSGLTQATARLLGRTTASSGAVEEITVGTGLTLSAGSLSASGGGGTAGTSILLDHTRVTDISALSVSANTWTDLIANLTFTPASATSVIEIVVRGVGFFNGLSGGQSIIASRIVVDSAGTPINEQLGGTTTESGTFRLNPFAGSSPIFLPVGVTAAAHTVKVQVWTNSSNTGFYLRSTTGSPNEFLRVQVIEHKN